MRLRPAGLVTALALVAAAAAFAGTDARAGTGVSERRQPAPDALKRAPAEATVEREANLLFVNASVTAPAPPKACFEVLTDYERLPEFVPGMRSSRIVSQPGEMLKVEQVGVTGPALFGITVRTTLGLTLTPPAPGSEGRIDFGASGGNLLQMYGAWLVRDEKGGCRIDYRATIEPDFPVPVLLGPFVMRRQIESQLDAIAREIARRQALPPEPTIQVTPLQ